MTPQRLLEEPQGRRFVPLLGDVAFQDLALMIDSTPQIVRLAIDLYEDLINVPAPVREAFHSAYPLALDIRCEHRPKPVPPQSHRLMTNVDATFEEQVFNISQR